MLPTAVSSAMLTLAELMNACPFLEQAAYPLATAISRGSRAVLISSNALSGYQAASAGRLDMKTSSSTVNVALVPVLSVTR